MPSGPIESPLTRAFPPEQIRGDDLFPEIISGEEVDRRISNSENRIKFWITACVASNMILALPTIFYMGRMAQSVDEMSSSVKDLQSGEKTSAAWVSDRRVWEAHIESELRAKGIIR